MSGQLLEPASLGGLNARNRIVRSATWSGLGNADGTIPGELLRIYKELAAGGVGAIVTGFTSVSDDD